MRQAAYVEAHASGLLAERIEQIWERMTLCRLCPRQCAVDRSQDELGFCQTGQRPKVASFNAHFGEEDPLVGTRGSGTIFFSHCNLQCLFCQNEDISLRGEGQEIGPDALARIMLHLQDQGCHNINLVTPTHVSAHILAALPLAVEGGLTLPLVYNCGGYESVETLKLLDGIIDIYMPDFKFGSSKPADRFCQAADYPERAKAAIAEMHRQVGDLVLDDQGLAVRGLLVRHLVLPNGLAGTREVVRFLADLSPETYLNVMAQYRPCGRAHQFPEINRRLKSEEHVEAVKWAFSAGLERLDKRRIFRLARPW
ncbi:MAG: radical SAM protein [Deltaproteobacteria bacterium]|nr:radical SAM protein [Deltaproteobacteria bacterium]